MLLSAHASSFSGRAVGVRAGYGTRVGIAGWVYRVYYPATARGTQLYSEAGPGSPARAGVGGTAGWARVPVPPSGPGRPAASLYRDPLGCRLWANKSEIPVILL